MVSIQRFHYPEDVNEVSRLLKDVPGSSLIAGGTSLGFSGFGGVSDAIDITNLKLGNITIQNGAVHLGALVTLQELAQHAGLKDVFHGILNEAALAGASRQVRNRATVGGGIASSYPWSDLNVALLALDATLVLQPGPEQVPLKGFLSKPKAERLGPGEWISEVIIERKELDSARFVKFSKTMGDISIVTVSAVYSLDGGNIKEVNIVVGGATAQPIFQPVSENVLAVDEIVIVRSRIPSSVAMGTCLRPSNVRCS